MNPGDHGSAWEGNQTSFLLCVSVFRGVMKVTWWWVGAVTAPAGQSTPLGRGGPGKSNSWAVSA